jgi:hypothetical protein
MKKVIVICLVLANTVFSAFSQSEKFAGSMGAALQEMQTAKTPEAMQALASKFERIGDAEKTQWLPFYYAALLKTQMSLKGLGGDKDKVADEASTLLDKAEAIEKENSEIYCVRSMIATAKMLVNPMERYMQYGAIVKSNIDLAIKANPSNPRPYTLNAINLKNTPVQFGGGCNNAKPIALVAQEKFIAFKAASALHPVWGKEIVDGIITDCK